MNKRQQGKHYEKEVKTILEEDGWTVETCNPKLMFIGPGKMISKAHDFFGAWDLIAKKPGEKTMWVQVSVWEMVSAKRKQVEDFPGCHEHDIMAIFARFRGRPPHYRVMFSHQDYEWKGDVRMIKNGR